MAGVRRACRARQLSRYTEAAYVHWVARYQRFLGLRRGAAGDEAAACRFLDHLVERGEVATSSHLQAINALVLIWLLSRVLRDEWGFDGVVVSDWGAVVDRVRSVITSFDWRT